MNALKKKFHKKETKSQIFIFGSDGSGKTTLLQILEKKLSMKHKGKQNTAGVTLETIKSKSAEIYSYHFDQSTFITVTQFIQQETTKCVIFVIDSRRKHIISDARGNDIRNTIKETAKLVAPECHILILCNKQDIQNEEVLSSDEITKILDIDRVFEKNKHCVLSCSFEKNTNTDAITSYLTDNKLVDVEHDDNDEKKEPDNDKSGKIDNLHKKNQKSFVSLFKRKMSKKYEVIMILGLDKVGKTRILDSFGFGKKSKTSIALFEAETIKYHDCQFHVWNYEQRSWPMCKSFFQQTTLVIYVIDSTQMEKLKSEKKQVWTDEAYLKNILGISHEVRKKSIGKNNMSGVAIPSMNGANPFAKSKSYEKDKHKTEHVVDDDEWPLKCPFLIYLNKTDLDSSIITKDDLEEQLQLSRIMKSKGIKHFVQESSAKTKKGIYDGLIWCYMNGLLKSITEIQQYAQKNDIKLPTLSTLPSPPPPAALKEAKTK